MATRIFIPSLIAILGVILSGCISLPLFGPDRFVTGGYQGNETLAVLLPESGRFADAAKVVHAGIIAAKETAPPRRRLQLRFYDSTTDSSTTLVREAIMNGADLVIGLLQKPAMGKLARLTGLSIPVLAMNHVSAVPRSPNLYQFALPPENEATDLARKA